MYFYHDKSYVLDLKTDMLTENLNKTAGLDETVSEESPSKVLTRDELITNYLSPNGYNADVKEKFETEDYTFLYFVRGDFAFGGNAILTRIANDGTSEIYSMNFSPKNSDDLKIFDNVAVDKENETVSFD